MVRRIGGRCLRGDRRAGRAGRQAPHAAIYERAFEVVTEVAGGIVPRERVLAIGDGT